MLAPGADVRVNDFFNKPLLETIEEIQKRFDARVEEKETLVGMIRLPIPDYSRIAFREALLNALLHRDFSQLGRFTSSGILIIYSLRTLAGSSKG